MAKQQCTFLLCRSVAQEMVRIHGLYRDSERITREVPTCQECAKELDEANRAARPVYLTPGAAVYVGPLERYIHK